MPCVIDAGGDCDSWEFFQSDTVKTRKPCKCCECGRLIEKGEERERDRGLNCGEFLVFNTCLDCASLRDLICGSAYGQLMQDLYDAVSQGDEDCLANNLEHVTPKGREMLEDIIIEVEKWHSGQEDDDEDEGSDFSNI